MSCSTSASTISQTSTRELPHSIRVSGAASNRGYGAPRALTDLREAIECCRKQRIGRVLCEDDLPAVRRDKLRLDGRGYSLQTVATVH